MPRFALVFALALICGCGGEDEAARPAKDPAIAKALAASPMFEAYSLAVEATTPDGQEHALRIAGDSEGPQSPLGEWAWEVEVREPEEAVRVVQAKIVKGRLQVRLGSDQREGFPYESPDIDYFTRLPRVAGLRKEFDLATPLDRRDFDPSSWIDGGGGGEAQDTATGKRLTVRPAAKAVADSIASLYETVDGIRIDLPTADRAKADVTVEVNRRGRVQRIAAEAPLDGGGTLRVEMLSQPAGLRESRVGGGYGGERLTRLPRNGRMAIPPRLREALFGTPDLPSHKPTPKGTGQDLEAPSKVE